MLLVLFERIVLERDGLNFEIQLNPVRLNHELAVLVTSCDQYFPIICNILDSRSG